MIMLSLLSSLIKMQWCACRNTVYYPFLVWPAPNTLPSIIGYSLHICGTNEISKTTLWFILFGLKDIAVNTYDNNLSYIKVWGIKCVLSVCCSPDLLDLIPFENLKERLLIWKEHKRMGWYFSTERKVSTTLHHLNNTRWQVSTKICSWYSQEP